MVILDSGIAIIDLHEDFSEAAACLSGCPAGVPADDQAAQGFVTYERFRRFLTAERQRLLSVEQAAREFGISPAYACRLFRRFGGTSPYQYLLRQEMQLAAELLTHDRLLVKQVAAHLGFTDPYQFSLAFTRVSGVAPGRLLRSVRG